MKDLFEHHEELPLAIQTVINNQGEIEDYDDCRELLAKLEVFGYTFEYGLDSVPYNLRKVVLDIENFDDVVTDKDGEKWSQLCIGHSGQMEDEGTKHFINSMGDGICGVKGCDVESEYYIDFQK
tara:strand:+ start:9304 stop:9675 length:372 start_codon:yes stop_codon:yes gene_type:complete